MFWPKRQFVDGYVMHPLRFAFKDISTNEVVDIYELLFAPGDAKQGIYTNRGYFQPIEDFLAEYSLNELRGILQNINLSTASKFGTIGNSIDALNARIANTETNLSRYASLSGTRFTNPTSNHPSASDNSTRIATTYQVRQFVAQYAFPPKNVKNLTVTPGELSLSIQWKDSPDFSYDNMLLSEWAGTKIVYRTDRYSTGPNDGTLLVDNSLKDWYSNFSLDMDNLDARLTYYIQAFPYSKKGGYNISSENRKSVTPLYSMVLLSPLSYWAGLYYSGRNNLAGATDGNGNILFGGGGDGGDSDGYSNQVDRYTPNGIKSTLATMRIGRAYHSAQPCGNYALFAGGYTGDNVWTNTVDRYDTSGNRTSLSNLGAARAEMGATTDRSKNAWFGGGMLPASPYSSNIVERYSPSGTRSVMTPLSQQRMNLACAADGSGNVWFAGGEHETPVTWGFSSVIDKYSESGVLTSYSGLSVARSALSGSSDSMGNVLFAGGEHNLPSYSSLVERFTPSGVRSVLDNLSAHTTNSVALIDGYGNSIIAGGDVFSTDGIPINRYAPNGTKMANINFLPYQGREYNYFEAAALNSKGNVLFASGDSYQIQSYSVSP